jgi:hypothetical protein
VPTAYRQVQRLAEFNDPVVLVVDQCLERADVERLEARAGAGLVVVGEDGADRQHGRLGLATGGGRRDDHVPGTVDDQLGGALLDVTQPVPTMRIDPTLDVRVVQLVRPRPCRRGRLRAGTR